MGCDYRHIFLEKDVISGKVKVEDNYSRSKAELVNNYLTNPFYTHRKMTASQIVGMLDDGLHPDVYEIDFDFVCRLAIESEYDFVIPCFIDDYAYQGYDKIVERCQRCFNESLVHFVDDNIYMDSFGKPCKSEPNEEMYVPMSCKEKVKSLFSVRDRFCHALAEDDKLTANSCKASIKALTEEIVAACKKILIDCKFNENKFYCVNYRSAACKVIPMKDCTFCPLIVTC